MNKLKQIFIDGGLAWDDDAKECANITEEISCQFLTWCFDKGYMRYLDTHKTDFWVKQHKKFEAKTTKELFQEFLKTL